MADLLRRGYSMLNLSCPVCNNPIFSDKKGEKFCPICKRKVLIVENSSNTHNQVIHDKYTESEKFALLEELINQKIDYFTQKLQNETQIDLIEKYTSILLKCTKLLLKLKNLK